DPAQQDRRRLPGAELSAEDIRRVVDAEVVLALGGNPVAGPQDFGHRVLRIIQFLRPADLEIDLPYIGDTVQPLLGRGHGDQHDIVAAGGGGRGALYFQDADDRVGGA